MKKWLLLFVALLACEAPAPHKVGTNINFPATPTSAAGGISVWASAQKTFLDSVVPGLTYSYVKPTDLGPPTNGTGPTAPTGDSASEGGGIGPTGAHYMNFTGVIYTDLTAKAHAWSTRAKLPVPSSSFDAIGPMNSGGDQYVNLVSYAPYDATHAVLQLFKAGSGNGTLVITSFVLDGNTHNYSVGFVGSKYTAYVDNVAAGNTLVLTNVTTGARLWSAYNGTGGDVVVYDLLYGYTPP
jgi:hypothetical protein